MMMVILHYPAVAPTLAEVRADKEEAAAFFENEVPGLIDKTWGMNEETGRMVVGLPLRGQGHRRRLVQLREAAQLPPGEQREPRILRRGRHRLYEAIEGRGNGVGFMLAKVL